MALPQDETINEQPSIDYEALGLEPVEDEDVFGGGIDAEVDEAKKPVSGEIDYEGLGLEPVEEEDVFGVTQEEPIPVTGEEGFLRQVADVPLKIGESINNSIKGITDLFGADNAISQNLSQNADWYRSLLSAQALEDEQEIGRILKAAEDEGILGQLGAGLEAFSVAPIDFVASGVGSLATFAAAGVAGRAAALAGAARAGLTGAKAAQFVQRGVQATQLATGAAMGAGIVKGEIYQSVKDEMLAQGKTEEDAKRIATEAQSYMGKNLDQILLGAGLGTIDAFTGAEKIIGKVLTKGGLKPDASRIGNIIKNGLTEAAPEFVQAAQEKFASNLALQREGINVPLTQGVFSQGALEGLVGLGLGVGAGAIEPRIQAPPTKEEVSAAAAETQDVARQNKDIVPATASLVEGEAEQIIQSQAETPDERVARLQREAQEAAGEIELEEEGAGLPPERIKSARWFESAARNRLKELQDKDDAGVEDFTTQERDEFEFLKTSPTPEQIAERYGYGVAPAVEPTAVTTTTPPTTPAVAEPAPVEPKPTLTPPPTVTEPTAPTTLQPDLLTPEGKTGEERSTIDQENRRKTEEFVNGLEDGEYQVFDSSGEKNGIAKVKTNKSGRKVVEYVTDDGKQFIGDAKSLVPELNFARFTDATGKEGFDRGSLQKITPVAPTPEAAPAAVEPTPVAPPVTPQLEPLRRVARAEQTEEDVAGLVDGGLVEVYNGQPVITQAGLEALPEAERPRLTPEARKIQIDTRTSEAAAEAISKNLRIGVDQVPVDVRMPEGWTLVGDVYVPPQPQVVTKPEAAPEVVKTANPLKRVEKDFGGNVSGHVKDGSLAEDILGDSQSLQRRYPERFATISVAKSTLGELSKNATGVRQLMFEHLGDLYHRAATTTDYQNMATKAEMFLRRFGRGLEREMDSQVAENTTYFRVTEKYGYNYTREQFSEVRNDPETRDAIDRERKNIKFISGAFASIYERMQAFTPLQAMGRNMAIAFGLGRYDIAEQLGNEIKRLTESPNQEAVKRGFSASGVNNLPNSDNETGKHFEEISKIAEEVKQNPSKAGAYFQEVSDRISNQDLLAPIDLLKQAAPTPEVREARREPAITPQQDRDYLDAVERGDLDAASRMVEDAAKAAGYTIKVYHGTPNLEFTEFKTRKGEYWFSEDYDIAKRYAEAYGANGRVITAYIRAQNPLPISGGAELINRPRRSETIEYGFDSVQVIPQERYAGQTYIVFNPEQIKSADPVTYDDAGNIIPLSQRFQPEQADIRYNPLGYDITTVVEDIKAGRTDGPLKAVNNVVMEASALRDRVKAESLRRQMPRARGKAAILERIARERSSGKLTEETAQALTDFVNSIRNEAILDTAISIRGAGGASNFDFGQSLVSFFLTQDQPKIGARVGIHEFWHGLARFLPQKEVDQMSKDYTKALGAYIKKNPWFLAFVGRYSLTPEQFEAYKIFNPKEAETKLVPVLDREGNPVKYQIKYDADNYRYIMLDEWIAEKMTDLVRGKQAIPDTFMGKLAKIIRDFMAMIRSKLGRDAYQSFYNLVTDPNQKIDLQRMAGVARPFQIYQPQDYDYSKDISDQIRYAPIGAEGKEYRAEGFPTFTEGTPEAATLKEMEASMAKVDSASKAKGGKPETYKISEIASVWMDSGLGERELQDAIVEYTNLTPSNAARVAKAIARQYDIQQSIATAFLETQTGLSVEALPEGVTLPKEVDPDRPKPVMQRLFDVFMGVRVPPVKIQVNEKTALKQQIRLKAAANRAAKAEQKRTAEEVVEIIKAMELLGPVRPKQVQALAKRAARVIWTSEKSVEAFSEYAAKVVENANYDADLREAKDAQKRAKQLSTQKKVAMSPQRQILEDVGRIPVNKLDDPRMFAEAVNYYLRGFKDVLSPDYVVIPDAEMESYLSGAQFETQRNQRDLDREANKRLAEKYGIDPEQVNEMMESIDILKQIEAQENREALENLLTEKAVETQQGLRGYDTDNLQADQRPIVAAMLKVDPKALDPEERQRFIRITNNIIYNNQTNGSEYFLAVAKGQQSAREAAQDSTMIAKNRAWINLLPRFISERMQRGWALELQSVADTFRNAFGKGAMAKMYDAIGMLDLNLGFTKANNVIDEIQEKIAEFHRNLEKKYKAAARNQDGLLAEGVVGFLIQSVPKKDELSSINQRRDLIKQDIANRKAATMEPDRVAMANRIEAILNRIDGDSVEAILNNMKREFPANHESLVWYKDTLLPQYKDFLKSFDENFNDQANNYENPNYLTIGFTSAGPSLAITPEEQSLFYDQVSLRPKQSAYTIKRVDYTTLPTDRTTGKPKEIEFNLRRNVFNSLSDQINKAYTSSGWQRIASFMKTPEAEIVFGGAANKDFFIERLNRLRLSRMRRGSMSSGGAIEKAVDSLSVISRKLGTGIALGGIYQWIKQPPDQLITALGSGGRYDLLAKNIAPSTQKAARELLNKFSIGRRGDASSGYKYINQMEGHQNRLERYFSESKWDQAKEQAGKVADVWMVALKSSDFLAASAAWMTYYEGELNKQDIKIDDWSKEAALIESDPKRRQAAAFAEQMTDIYQGSSDPTSMATFAQSGKTGWENLVKAIFVPFNSFAIQQRMRLYSDARDVLNGSAGGKGGLAGTIGGLILFHATKRYAIPAISGAGIAVLYGLMGVDMEEPDEEKQKEEANKNWRQFLADITGNLLVGGTPQIIESQFIDAMNRASYLVSLQLENDSILNDDGEIMSYDQYSKERSPFYRYKSYDNAMSLGMLEIGLGQAEQVALQTKMLATPEEMEMYTPEEQRLLYFSTLSEWLYLMRLNDADFARLVSRARRDMIKAAEDREKEIKRIREGR